MKMYKDFITEANKFAEYDIVKRVSDGKIGIVKFVNSYSNGVNRYMKYTIDFGDEIHKYLAKELEKPTIEERIKFREEMELRKTANKYNL